MFCLQGDIFGLNTIMDNKNPRGGGIQPSPSHKFQSLYVHILSNTMSSTNCNTLFKFSCLSVPLQHQVRSSHRILTCIWLHRSKQWTRYCIIFSEPYFPCHLSDDAYICYLDSIFLAWLYQPQHSQVAFEFSRIQWQTLPVWLILF